MALGRYLRFAVIAASILPGSAPAQTAATAVSGDAATANDEAAIRSALASYNAALNGGKRLRCCPSIPMTAFSCRLTASRR
jgi:hypothetical protein